MAIDVSTITVAQFQAQFFRDFPYLDDIFYNPTQVYNTGDEVYFNTSWYASYDTGGNWDSGAAWDSFVANQNNLKGGVFYQALVDDVEGITPVSDPTKWVKCVDSIYNYIWDQDILNAFAEAQIPFNTALFQTDADTTLGFLYLTAHFLCNDIKASSQGINAPGAFPVSSRSAGNVSESYSVPQAYLDSPIYSMYTQSSYGMKYLMLILPMLTGNVQAVWGGTRA